LRGAGFTVHALVGRDPERTARRAARLNVAHACTSLAEALRLPGVEVVTIATPPDTHTPLVLEAVEAARHVVCEKPFALDTNAARTMLAAATAAGVVGWIGHEFRWAPERALVGRVIAEGLIGQPRLAAFISHIPLVADPSVPVPEWWFDAERGGGWLGASGSHLIDQVHSWLGDVEGVSATLAGMSARAVGADDTFTVRFHTRAGVDGVLQQTAAAWGPMMNLTRVAGTEGTVWIDGEHVRVADAGGERAVDMPADLQLPPVAVPDSADDSRHRFTHLELAPYTQLCRSLRDAIEGHPATGPAPATFTDGVACMEVLDAIRRSSAAGGQWSPVQP
jgi:predicted dehydrogenase